MTNAGGLVEIRAFRGSRRSSVYREHVLSEHGLARILAAAQRTGLPLLASLEQDRPHQLDKQEAQQIADEATLIRVSGELPELDDHLTAIAEVAHWCARTPGASWIRIKRR